jgi:hypothetical protein
MQRMAIDAAEVRAQRRRARRIMLALIAVCIVVVLGLALYAIRAEGVDQFLYRAPGVGASTPAPDPTN